MSSGMVTSTSSSWDGLRADCGSVRVATIFGRRECPFGACLRAGNRSTHGYTRPVNGPAIEAAVRELSTMFEPDGFRLERREDGGRVELRVVPTDAACADCLVPKQVMQTIMLSVFDQHGAGIGASDLVLIYPSDQATP